MVPDPATGRVRPWTRATTLAGTIADRYALEKWGQRQVVAGMARQRSLLVQAVAAGDDKDALERVVDGALAAMTTTESADVGIAIHRIAERIDSGETVDVPQEYERDVFAYREACERHGIEVVDGWLERFVVCPEVGAAGTPDRLVTWAAVDGPSHERNPALPIIADIKTGASVIRYGGLETAAQLAIYAHASHWWDGRRLQPMPEVDQRYGLVLYMPAGMGKCTVYTVDLELGWKAARIAAAVRELRKLGEQVFTEL